MTTRVVRAGVNAAPRDARGRIADAAIELVADHGLDRLTVRSTAHVAGVSIGAVQHHFPTRTELVVGAFERSVARQTRRFETARGTDAIERLGHGLGRLLPHDRASREDATVWLAISSAAAHDDTLTAVHRRTTRALQRAIAHALGVDEATARSIEAIVDGTMLRLVANRQLADHTVRRELLAHVRSLAATAAATPSPAPTGPRR